MPFYVYTLIPLLSHFNKFFFSETAYCIQTFSRELHHIPETKTILNRFYLYYSGAVTIRRRMGDDSHFVTSLELWDYGTIPQRDVIIPSLCLKSLLTIAKPCQLVGQVARVVHSTCP